MLRKIQTKVVQMKRSQRKFAKKEWLLFLTPLLILPVLFVATPATNYIKRVTTKPSETAQMFPVGSQLVRKKDGSFFGKVVAVNDDRRTTSMTADGKIVEVGPPSVLLDFGPGQGPLRWVNREALRRMTRSK
jgi:hypothetical protein